MPAAGISVHALTRWKVGAILIIQGFARLRLIDIGGPTIESTARFNTAMHLQPSLLWSYYVTGLELVGALLLFIGLPTRPVAALLVTFLVVATFYVTPHFGFWSRDGGAYSLDRRLRREL